MALKILNKNGTFELCGNLNSETSRSFIIHFEHLLNTTKIVTVNIDKIKKIDTWGIEALKTLIAISLKSNNQFYIIGNRSKEIYDYKSKAFAA